MEITGKQSTTGMLPYLNSPNGTRSPDKHASRQLPDNNDKDKVILSPGAREVQEALRRVADEPDVRTDKVSALREQVQSGVYHFDGRKIAMKMISEHLIDQVL